MRESAVRTLKRFDLLIITALFLLLTPILSVQRTTDFIIFCVFVLSYDLLYGYLGRLSFGHMLYLGVGAYAPPFRASTFRETPLLRSSWPLRRAPQSVFSLAPS